MNRSLTLGKISLVEANSFVSEHHRHHPPVVGNKFSLGAFITDYDSEVNLMGEHDLILVGVAIVGRPVSRILDDGKTLEVNRLCTDGTRNACSFLYGAAARTARSMGYSRIITYILQSEHGITLKASGWTFSHTTQGGSWNKPSRPRQDKMTVQTQNKKCYVKILKN